jgi:hypothetical protein
MKIETSLDWQQVSNNLLTQLHSIDYNSDLYKMLKNISSMVDELNKLEVEARRRNKPGLIVDDVEKINQAINHLEKLILIAKLMN